MGMIKTTILWDGEDDDDDEDDVDVDVDVDDFELDLFVEFIHLLECIWSIVFEKIWNLLGHLPWSQDGNLLPVYDSVHFSGIEVLSLSLSHSGSPIRNLFFFSFFWIKTPLNCFYFPAAATLGTQPSEGCN